MRFTRTTEVFRSGKRKDADLSLPIPAWTATTRRPMLRLTWSNTERLDPNWSEVIQRIDASGSTSFFVDNGVFDDATPDEVWRALLAQRGRLVITPKVWEELKHWLTRRPTHPVNQAIRQGEEGPIAIYGAPGEDESGYWSYIYYLGLLAVRHDVVNRQVRSFTRDRGRPPDEQELLSIRQDIQKMYGPRALLIADKPAGQLTDEALVYLAVEHALSTGRPSVILTKDQDVPEQLFKLLWLIETHYRGKLLADRYALEFSRFRTRQFPEHLLRAPQFPFEPRNALLIERDAMMRDLLPASPHPVLITCAYVSSYFSFMNLQAETEMAQVLEMKDRTRGRNTDRLGDRNLHASVAQIPIGGKKDFAAIAHDRLEPSGITGLEIPRLDIWQAISDAERFGTVNYSMTLLNLPRRLRRQ